MGFTEMPVLLLMLINVFSFLITPTGCHQLVTERCPTHFADARQLTSDSVHSFKPTVALVFRNILLKQLASIFSLSNANQS